MAVGLIEVTSNTILKPYSPPSTPTDCDVFNHKISEINNSFCSPTSTHHPLFNSQVPLNIFDRASYDVHVATLYAFRSPVPDNEALIEGLSKVLFYYPHLSGRIVADENGCPCIVFNDAGIRLVEANFMTTTLEENLPLVPSEKLSELHPPIHPGVEELLQIQLNRFACGGLVMGVTSNHRVADGQSMSIFLVNWSMMVRGFELDCIPYHDRLAVAAPRNPPRCDFDHRDIEFTEIPPLEKYTIPSSPVNVDHVALHFSAEFIAKLKGKITTRRCSTFQCLLTHVWKKLTQARGLDKNLSTQVKIAVNGRARMRSPAVPMEYFGNLVLWANPKMNVGELLEASYAHVADNIHQAVGRIDDAYFRSFADFGETMRREGKEDLVNNLPEGKTMCPNLEVDSWLSFNFHDLDFGGGAPCAFVPPSMAVEGLLVFVPSCENKGGVDVFAGVMHEEVDLFKRISYSLDD